MTKPLVFTTDEDPKALSHIYVVRCGEFRKVGFARDVQKRMGQIRTCNPHICRLEAKYEVPAYGAKTIEAEIHKRLKRHHHRGEWFHADKETVLGAIAVGLEWWSGLDVSVEYTGWDDVE